MVIFNPPRQHFVIVGIIRNTISFCRISEYIENNPANWKEDTFHFENLEESKFGKE